MVEGCYDIGEIREIYEIFGGYTNRSFGLIVQTKQNLERYFLRQYQQDTTTNDILFEHALINHCIAKGFTLIPAVIPNRQGVTYVKPANSRHLFAVYDFLRGDDKYTWDNPTLHDEEYASAATTLATFHHVASDFNPRGRQRAEAQILDLLPTFSTTFQRLGHATGTRPFHEYFVNHLDQTLIIIDQTYFDETDIHRMPRHPIHGDYHPGNLKFQGNQVVGMFDFDWSKLDLRLFDVCLAVVYFCSRWEDGHDGELRLDKGLIFLRAYQAHMRCRRYTAPLNEVEINRLPTMLAAANLYVMHWMVTAYDADKDLHDAEYLSYLKHAVRLMYWIEDHTNDIAHMATAIR